MTYEKFARLEDTEHGQCLATIQNGENDEGQEGPTVAIRSAGVNGVEPTVTLGPWPDTDAGWEQAHKAFKEIDLHERAAEMNRLVSGLLD